MKSRKIELDIIRIIACAMVFMLHTLGFSKELIDFSKEGLKVCWFYTPAWGGGMDVLSAIRIFFRM